MCTLRVGNRVPTSCLVLSSSHAQERWDLENSTPCSAPDVLWNSDYVTLFSGPPVPQQSGSCVSYFHTATTSQEV